MTVLPISSSSPQLSSSYLHDARSSVERGAAGRCMMALVDTSGGVSFTVLHAGLVPPSEGLVMGDQHVVDAE